MTSSAGGSRATTTVERAKASAASEPEGAAGGRSPLDGGGSPTTTLSGDAVFSNADRRPAHRQAAQSANATRSAGGPKPVTFASGRSGRSVTADDDRPTTHPPTRRPPSGTRTIVPTATRRANASGTE